jgi:FKBP-type peptidyl-prolyl cis-trans isomerase
MRPTALILAIALAATAAAPLAAGDAPPAGDKPATTPAAAPAAEDTAMLRKQVSWLVGLQLKSMVDRAVTDGELDRAEILRGLNEAEAGSAKAPPQAEQQAIFEKYNAQLQAVRAKAGENRLAGNKEWLATNAKKPGMLSTASGLQYEILSRGPEGGKMPKATSKVRVNYKGSKLDGSVFDASEKHGGPAEFPLDGVIKGWTEGLQLMREGDKFRFTIPSELAYGEQGPPAIGANQILIFDVEMIAVLSDPK